MTQKSRDELRLEVLGGLHVTRDGQPLTGFYSRKIQALLVYLAIMDRPQPREKLTGLLWGDVPESSARASLRQALTNLRALVGEHLISNRQTVALRPEQVWIDARAFEDQLRPLTPGGAMPETAQLETAIALYHGNFLEGVAVPDAPTFDQWVTGQRERLRALAVKALLTLATQYEADANYPAGIAALQRLLTLDPWREESHRQLMRLLARSGQRSAALSQYESCRRTLARELGVEPEPDTIALCERIKRGELRPEPRPAAPRPPVVKPRMPPPPTPFIGREAELTQIGARLADPNCRLLSLVGPGGSGKTRLALQAVEERQSAFADGARVVPLAAVSDSNEMILAIATALDTPLDESGDWHAQLLSILSDKTMLLMLDNFEHLLSAAPLLTDILTAAPGVKLLITSRERLALQAEWLMPVGGLLLPGSAVSIDASSAVRLFMDRARQVQPDLDPAHDTPPSVVRICELVEGMPLAIELAASWARTHSCREIAEQIASDLDFLATTMRDVPARHRSLRAVFDHSWALLNRREQQIFPALATFHGGIQQTAALAVAGASTADLMSLVDKSLLRRSSSGRYIMHELVRQYAAECLDNLAGGADTVHQRHAKHFIDFLQASEPLLKETRQIETLQTIEADIANVRAAWRWVVEQRDASLAGRALDGLCLYYDLRGLLHEGLATTESGISAFEGDQSVEHDIIRGRLLGWQGRFRHFLGHYPESEALVEAGRALLQQHGAEQELAFYLSTQGRNANMQGRHEEALQLQQAALAQAEAGGDRYAMGLAYKHLGGIAFNLASYAEAGHWFQKSLEIRQEIGDWLGIAEENANLGEVAQILGDYPRAERRSENSVALYRELGRHWRIVYSLDFLAEVRRAQGRYAEAAQLYQQCLEASERGGDRRAIGTALLGLARVALNQHDVESARAHVFRSLEIYEGSHHQRGRAGCRRVLARIAMHSGEPLEARRHARKSLAIAIEINDRLTIAAARTILGRVALSLNAFAEAREEFTAAFETLRTTGARPAMLDVIAATAELLVVSPDIDHGSEHPHRLEQAAGLLTFVTRDPATWHETRVAARGLLATLADRIPSQAISAAEERATMLTLDDTLAMALQTR